MITGGDQAEHINAGDGDDTISGGAGDDTIFGNDGEDIAVFSGSYADYSWTVGKGNSWIVDGADGTDTLKHIEGLQFDDYTVYIDGRNNAPAITDGDTAGAVNEDDVLSASGSLSAIDFDGDDLSWSIDGDGVGAYGSLSMDADGNWTYTLDNESSAVQDLNDGDTVTDSFDVIVSDGNGGTTSETITVTVAGADDGSAPQEFNYGRLSGGWGNPYWENISTFTNDAENVQINAQSIYAMLDDNFIGGQAGFDFYDGDDNVVFRLRDATDAGYTRNDLDLGDGNDTFLLDSESAGSAHVYGFNPQNTFLGGLGDDSLTFNLNGGTAAWSQYNTINTGEGNDSMAINITDGGSAFSGEHSVKDYTRMGAGDDSYTVTISASSANNAIIDTWSQFNGESGNDTVTLDNSGVGSVVNNSGLYGTWLMGDGDDVMNLNVVAQSGEGASASIQGGVGTDILNLLSGNVADFTVTQTAVDAYTIDYDGQTLNITGFETVNAADGVLIA